MNQETDLGRLVLACRGHVDNEESDDGGWTSGVSSILYGLPQPHSAHFAF
jgi:hypothetical protein